MLFETKLSATIDLETLPAAPTTMELVERFEHRDPITSHPYLQRLASEPVNLGHLWRLLANFQISISKNFARRLAGIAGRVEEDTIRCILAEQLNDEMGGGKFDRAHINLFARMMQQLAPWKPATNGNDALGPGKTLDVRLASIYGASDVYESVGAVIAGEIFGKQMDKFIADEFRRQSEVNLASLEWLTLHEQLEVSHADSSPELARLVPKGAAGAACRGGLALARAGWSFFDDLNTLCYGQN
jgi:hypothetical protein